jgi:hypothetical protein
MSVFPADLIGSMLTLEDDNPSPGGKLAAQRSERKAGCSREEGEGRDATQLHACGAWHRSADLITGFIRMILTSKLKISLTKNLVKSKKYL